MHTAPTKAEVIAALGQQDPCPSSDFDLNPDSAAPNVPTRAAAVMVPIWDPGHGEPLRLILTKRAAHLKAHPGQIAFPGGAIEARDGTAECAALREMEEEIGVPQSLPQVLGTLPPHRTITDFDVVPILGWLDGPFTFHPDPMEVAEVFWIPLSHALNPDNFRVEGRLWQGRRRCFYTVPYGPYYIWGATARILRGFAARFAP